MQMEDNTPVVKVIDDKPPTEPPPSLENTTEEEDHWLEDVKTTANKILRDKNTSNLAIMKGTSYSPFISDLPPNISLHQHLLQNKICMTYRTNHPITQHLFIPTPKSSSHIINQFDQTNWKENETINLDNTTCNNIEVHNTSSQTYDEQVSTIWDNMVGSHKKNSRVNILADESEK